MHYAALLLVCCLPLAACGNEPDKVETVDKAETAEARDGSAADGAEQVAETRGGEQFVRPGKWQSRIQIESVDMPGAPPAAASAMRNMQQRVQVNESCLTPEQAKRPKMDFFAGKGKNCRSEKFTMSGGKIDAVMKCSDEAMTQTMVMQGTYAPNDYQMRMTMNAQPRSGPTGAMTMKMRVDAKRLGECDGKTA